MKLTNDIEMAKEHANHKNYYYENIAYENLQYSVPRPVQK
jgi:hypothetical protein